MFDRIHTNIINSRVVWLYATVSQLSRCIDFNVIWHADTLILREHKLFYLNHDTYTQAKVTE